MVGTSAFTKCMKLDLSDHDKNDLGFNTGQKCENIGTQPNYNSTLEDESSQVLLINENRPPHVSRRIPKGGYGSFRNFYLLAVFVLFFIAAFILTCAVKKMFLPENVSNLDSSSTFGTNVLVYDGKRVSLSWPDPPPHEDLPAVARYVMHISEWGSLSTNSTHKGIEGYPFVNVFSVSDGPIDNSTGVPYFYLTPLELSVKDMEVNNKVSFTVSEAQSDYCNKKGFDPEDPRCAHIVFTGSLEKIEKGSEEEKFARHALFSRHEEMKDWPPGHAWFCAKLNIIHIYVLDFFGGAGVVSPEDYYAANPFLQ